MANNKEATVQECEEYIVVHGIQAVLKDAIAKLCQDRPPNPMRYLRDYFDNLSKLENKVILINWLIFCTFVLLFLLFLNAFQIVVH